MPAENLLSGALGPGPIPARPQASASRSDSGTATASFSSSASASALALAPAPAPAPTEPRTPHPHVFRVAENLKMRLEQDRLKRQAEHEAKYPLDLSQLADELGPYCNLLDEPSASVTSSSSFLCSFPPPFARIPPELRAPPNQELIYECQYPPAHLQPPPQNPTPWHARFPVAGLPFTSSYYEEEDGDDNQDQDQDQNQNQNQNQNQEQDPFKDFAEIASASGPLPAATATATDSQRRSPTADIYFENRRLARINGAIFIHSPFATLYPLMDPSTGEPCIWFPKTIPELHKTGINAINQMLCIVWKGFDLNADKATKIDWIAHQWVQFTQ